MHRTLYARRRHKVRMLQALAFAGLSIIVLTPRDHGLPDLVAGLPFVTVAMANEAETSLPQ